MGVEAVTPAEGFNEEGWVVDPEDPELELVTHAHQGYVATTVWGGRFAVCMSCSFQGTDRGEKAQAIADLDEHLQGTGYRYRMGEVDGQPALQAVARGGIGPFRLDHFA